MNNLKEKIKILLKNSEKYTKTNMLYVANGGFWLFISQASIFILGIAPTILFANLLPKEIYGQYNFMLSFFSILSITAIGGTTTAYISAVSRGNEGDFLNLTREKIKWGFIGTLISVLLSLYYFLQNELLLGQSFLLISIFIPFSNAFLIFKNILVGRKLFRKYSQYNILLKTVSVITIIPCLYLTDNLLIILFIFLGSNLLINLFCFIIIYTKYKPNKNKEGQILEHSKHLSIIGVLGEIANHADKIIIFYFFGSTELAIYFLAITIPNQIRMIFQEIPILLLPQLSKYSFEDIKKNISHKTKSLSIILTIAIVVYIITSPYIYQLFFPQFKESVIYSQIFSISLFSLLSIIPNTALQSHHKTKSLYISNTSNHIIHILLLIIGSMFFGIIGMIIAKIIAKFLEVAVSYFILIYKT